MCDTTAPMDDFCFLNKLAADLLSQLLFYQRRMCWVAVVFYGIPRCSRWEFRSKNHYTHFWLQIRLWEDFIKPIGLCTYFLVYTKWRWNTPPSEWCPARAQSHGDPNSWAIAIFSPKWMHEFYCHRRRAFSASLLHFEQGQASVSRTVWGTYSDRV